MQTYNNKKRKKREDFKLYLYFCVMNFTRNSLSRLEIIAYILFTTLIGVYLILRALEVNILDDEGQTLRFYIQNCRPFIWQSGYISAPNNHFLNTILSLFSSNLFGHSTLALRLPSLIFFPLFAIYLFRIGQQFQNKLLVPFFWVSILGTHYLIEFFAYSRGYAIGNSLLLVCTFHSFRFWKNNELKDLKLTAIALTLGMSANLNLLWCALAIVFALSFSIIRTPYIQTRRFKQIIIILWLVVVSFISYAFYLKSKGQLYIGTPFGVYAGLDTFLPVITPIKPGAHHLYLLTIIPLLTLIFLVLKKWWSGKVPDPSILYVILLFANLGATFAMMFILGTKMPVERTILHWYLLFTLAFFFCLDYLNPKWLLLLILPFLTIPIRSISQLSLNRPTSPLWAEEFVSQKMFTIIDSLYRNSPHTTIATNLRSYKHILDFEAFKVNGNAPILNFSDTPLTKADYQLINLKHWDYYSEDFKIILKDSISGTAILKRNHFLERKTLLKQEKQQHETDEGFYQIFRIYCEKMVDDAYVFNFSLQLEARDCFDGVLAIQGKKNNEPTGFWWQTSLGALSENWTGKDTLNLSALIEKIPEENEYLDVYLWNIANDDYTLKKASLQIDILH